MIETINGKAYLKVGDKVYELGGGSNIITADSVEQLPDPASVPENTIAFVKSGGGGGGGLPVVEFSTDFSLPIEGDALVLSEADSAVMDAVDADYMYARVYWFGAAIIVPMATIEYEGMLAYNGNLANGILTIAKQEGVWMVAYGVPS